MIFQLALLFVCVVGGAQNLNPTVEVTNDYSGTFSAATRSSIPMAVPDSLLQFRKDFDYSVFDNPFKGSYEFVPFTVRIKPEAGNYGNRVFYLRAGAGYTVHPVLDMNWSPLIGKKGKFQLDLYQRGSGYWGPYRGLSSNGYDFSENAGVFIRALGGKSTFTADVSYDGIFCNVGEISGMFNSAVANFRVKSFASGKKYFHYDFDARYRFTSAAGAGNLQEHDIRFDGSLTPVFGTAFRVPIDFEVTYNTLGRAFVAWAAPHIELTFGPVDLRAGVRMGFHHDGTEKINRLTFHPDVNLKIDIVKSYFTFYAAAVGSPRYNSFSELLHLDHFNATIGGMSLCDADFYGGFRGGAGGRLHYDIGGGYAMYSKRPFDAVVDGMLPGYVFQGVNMVHADARLSWKSESVETDAALHFRKAYMREEARGFEVPMFCGDFRFEYNYRKRVFAGISVEGAMDRYSVSDTLPWYVNLGVSVEYRICKSFSLWAKGDNLLNMEIRRVPYYAERGVNFTAGICVNF